MGRIGFIIFEMFKEFLTTFVLIIRMFQVDYILALVSLIVLPLILQIVRKYTKKIRKSGRVRQDMAGAITAFTQESLSGIFVVKAFNAMKIMISKYEKISYEEFQKSFRTAKIKAKVSPINELITTLMIILVALYGGYKIIVTKDITSGDLVSFVTALGLMQQPLKRLVAKNNELQESIPSADRVLEILEEKIEQEFTGEEKHLCGEVEKIEIENVSFSYPESEEKVLENINLSVKAGEVVALVGKSGSGKSTLVNLLARFYDIVSGKIKINGLDSQSIPLSEFRNYIGVVPQESFCSVEVLRRILLLEKKVSRRLRLKKLQKWQMPMSLLWNYRKSLKRKWENVELVCREDRNKE